MPNKKTTIDSKIDGLAVAVKRGFDAVDKRFDGIEAQIVDLREEIRQIRTENKINTQHRVFKIPNTRCCVFAHCKK